MRIHHHCCCCRCCCNNGQGAGWPSTTGNPSGGDRDNNPPKGK